MQIMHDANVRKSQRRHRMKQLFFFFFFSNGAVEKSSEVNKSPMSHAKKEGKLSMKLKHAKHFLYYAPQYYAPQVSMQSHHTQNSNSDGNNPKAAQRHHKPT